MKRTRRDPSEQAQRAERYAESLEAEHGKRDRRTLEAWDVAADAWEEAGATNAAHHIRLSKIMAVTGKGYGYGISPPHGIFTKGATIDLLDDEDFTRINTAWWGDLYTRILRHLT